MTMCPQCGVELTEGAAFCHKCGATVASEQDDTSQDAGAGPDVPPPAPAADRFPQRAAQATAADRFRSATAARQNDDDDDEEVDLWEGDFSPKAMTGTWIMVGLVTIAAIVVGFLSKMGGTAWGITAGVIVLLWLGTLLLLWYRQFSVQYRLTNQRLIHQKGLLSRVTDRIEVIDMDDITFSQGVIERILGVGTITITSSDRTHPEIVLPGIDNVRDVSSIMDDARRKERRRRGLHIEAV